MPNPLPAPLLEPIKVIANILQAELALPAGQIMLGLENWPIPKNTGLYIVLTYGPEQTISNTNSSALNQAGDFVEVQEAVMLHTVEIDAMSFDDSARLGKEKILWALASYAAQEAMETFDMRIASTPSSFVAIPSLEETKYLNRFKTSFAVNALHRNVKIVPYYDKLGAVTTIPNA